MEIIEKDKNEGIAESRRKVCVKCGSARVTPWRAYVANEIVDECDNLIERDVIVACVTISCSTCGFVDNQRLFGSAIGKDK